MQRQARQFLRALLPLVPLAMCSGCGGGGDSQGAQASAPPAAPPPPATVNHAPTISGAATEVARVGVSYDYLPVATDPDGDALRFTAVNLPPWASLDPSSGRITGTPGVGDVGIHESITITVADASQQAVSAPFSITVFEEAGAGAGVASLQWEVPPSKVDGSPLDDLAGYRILYGRDSSDLDNSVLIGNPATTSYDFATLDPGVWFFAVVAVNAGGLEGPQTTLATKSI